MTVSDAYQTSLLATLCCIVLLLLTILAHSCRKSMGNPVRETATTYRISGIPCDWDQSRLQTFLDDKSAKLIVKSLAPEILGDEKTATCTFHGPRPSKPPDLAQLSVDHDFHNITTLYAPSPDDHKIDIVAISGLGGHAFGSFKAKNVVDHMWLRDSLPQDIIDEETKRPMARIMTYGYDSRLADSRSFQNLQDLAIKFSLSLSTLIKAPAAPKPILIIAHSLGGLIVKLAMIELSKSKRGVTAELYRAVYGIVFFGVPHAGMDIEHLLPMVGDGPNRSLVESLSPVNDIITQQASRDFPSGLGGEGDSETLYGSWKMSKHRLAILVSRSSATRYCSRWENGPEHTCAIARNHSSMVKFEPHDDEYKNVRGKLAGIARGALLRKPKVDVRLEEARRRLQELSGKLVFDQMNSKYEGLKDHRVPGTCQWLFDSVEFRAWKSGLPPGQGKKPSILVLAGRPGCGKSVLMMAAQQNETNQRELSDHPTVGFYFDALPNVSIFQKSSVGFYRFLLYKLLKRLEHLDVEALVKLEGCLSEPIYYDISSAVLQQAILKTLHHMAVRSITIFLDGLDECIAETMDSRAEANGVLKFLNKLPSTGIDLSICISTRDPTAFGVHLKPTHTVWVDRRNGDDIRTFLRGKLSDEDMLRPELRRQILQRVHNRASNIFLWVDLVITMIESKLGSGKRDQYLLDLVDAIPDELPALYRSLLAHVDAPDRKEIQPEAQVLLQQVQVAARPLTVIEAGGLLAFVRDDRTDARHQYTVAELENRIRFVSCGLIECSPDTINSDQPVLVLKFIHKSVGDFVLEEQDPLIIGNPARAVPEAQSQLQVTKAQQSQLAKAQESQFQLDAAKRCLDIVQQAIDSLVDDDEDPPAMLPYAAQFWMLHARKGEDAMGVGAAQDANDYPQFVTRCGDEAEQVATWYKRHLAGGSLAHLAMNVADVPNGHFVQHERCLLVLLAFEGCTRLVARHIESGCPCCDIRASSSSPSTIHPSSSVNEDDSRNNVEKGNDNEASGALAMLQRAVFLAALRGYHSTVEVLLDFAAVRGIAPTAVVDAHYQGRETALVSACYRGYEECVQTLLDRGADMGIEARLMRHGLPLHAAVAQGYLKVVRLVLGQQLKRGKQSKRECEAVLELMAQEDTQGYSAVQVAVENGRPEELHALLKTTKTVAGREALEPLLQESTGLGIDAYTMAKHLRDTAKGARTEDTFARVVEEMEKYLLSG